MNATRLLVVCLAIGLLVASAPGASLATGSTGTDTGSSTDLRASDVNATEATTGQQITTVIEVTAESVTDDIDQTSFEAKFEDANASARADLLADRAATLRERTNRTIDAQHEATNAYAAGEISKLEFAQRIARLSAQANSIDRNFDHLDELAEDVSALELRAAGYDRTANEEARDRLSRLTNAGATALLSLYTGEQRGEFSLEIDDGFSIEVEHDDGERSREFQREQPGDGSFQVSLSEALDSATELLATDLDGEWTLRSVEQDEGDGYYRFAFTFFGPETIGDAEVDVDGQTGEVFEFEEELEPRDADDDVIPLSIRIVDGTVEPRGTVTLAVTAAGQPIDGAIVDIEGHVVGETDADGRITITLPNEDAVDIEVEHADRDAELELTLRATSPDEIAEAEIRERLSVTGSLEGGIASIMIAYDGEPVPDVAVYADGERVGTTDANGMLAFDADADDDELEMTLVKGAFEVELEFAVEDDGTLALDEMDVDDHERADELSIRIVSGDPAPGATVTLEVTDRDGVVAGAFVEVEGEDAGTTDNEGLITVTLPDEDEVEIEVEDGDRDGEITFVFVDD